MSAAHTLVTDAFTCSAAGFLCHDGNDGLVVAVPVAYSSDGESDEFARWLPLHAAVGTEVPGRD